MPVEDASIPSHCPGSHQEQKGLCDAAPNSIRRSPGAAAQGWCLGCPWLLVLQLFVLQSWDPGWGEGLPWVSSSRVSEITSLSSVPGELGFPVLAPAAP